MIRHGEAEHLVTDLIGGWTDTKLTERGRLQAEALGSRRARTKGEAEKIFREPTKPLIDWQPYPNSETWREFYVRVSEYLHHLSEGCPCTPVVVTHGGTLTNIVGWWLGLDMEAIDRVSFKVAPASLTVLGTSNLGERTIERLNDVNHLLSAGLLEDALL